MAYMTPKDIAKAGLATNATKATHARAIQEEPGARPSGAEERPERREPVGAR